MLCSLSALAQESSSDKESQRGHPKVPTAYTTVSVSYFSWQEQLTLTSGASKDHGLVNLFGDGFSIEHENYFKPHHGTIMEGSFLYGQATAGGTQSTLPYTTTNIKWTALQASYRYSYRWTTAVATSIGLMAVDRQLSLPTNTATNTSAEAGPSLNYGILIDFKLRPAEHWQLRQMIGTLATQATTYWSLGFGYQF